MAPRTKRNKMTVAAIDPWREILKEEMEKLCNIPKTITEKLINAGFRKTLEKLILHRLLERGEISRKEPSMRPILIKSNNINHLMISQSGRNVVKTSQGRESRRPTETISSVAERLSQLGSGLPERQTEELKAELKSLSKTLISVTLDQSGLENVESDVLSDNRCHREYQSAGYSLTEGGRLIKQDDGGLEFSLDGSITNCELSGYGDDIDINSIDDGGKIQIIFTNLEQEDVAEADPVEKSEIENMEAIVHISNEPSSAVSGRHGYSFQEGLNEVDCEVDGEEAEEKGFEDRDEEELDGDGLEEKSEPEAEAGEENNGCHISCDNDDNGKQEGKGSAEVKLQGTRAWRKRKSKNGQEESDKADKRVRRSDEDGGGDVDE